MESKDSLSIKRTLYNLGTQHNKLTTMVMVCLNQIEKLKSELNELKASNGLEVSTAQDNEMPSVSNQQELESEAQNILKQLNLK